MNVQSVIEGSVENLVPIKKPDCWFRKSPSIVVVWFQWFDRHQILACNLEELVIRWLSEPSNDFLWLLTCFAVKVFGIKDGSWAYCFTLFWKYCSQPYKRRVDNESGKIFYVGLIIPYAFTLNWDLFLLNVVLFYLNLDSKLTGVFTLVLPLVFLLLWILINSIFTRQILISLLLHDLFTCSTLSVISSNWLTSSFQ